MRNPGLALLFCMAVAGAIRASDAGQPAPVGEASVLTDGVDLDKLSMDANGSDPAARAAAIKTLEGVAKKNPTGKRHLAYGAVGLDVPTWAWDYNRKLDIRGISVDLRSTGPGGDTASVLVDRLPGLSDAIVANVVGDLPEGATVSKTALTVLGKLAGSGTRETVALGGPAPQRLECVLFYPKGAMEGYYIFTMFSGPQGGDATEREVAKIAQSIGRQ
jgi:hypothetical protein